MNYTVHIILTNSLRTKSSHLHKVIALARWIYCLKCEILSLKVFPDCLYLLLGSRHLNILILPSILVPSFDNLSRVGELECFENLLTILALQNVQS